MSILFPECYLEKMSAALYLGEIRSRAWRGCMAEDAPTRILRDPHPSDPDTLGHILVLEMREISAKFFKQKDQEYVS
jgi:hypothetical protein